MKTLRRLTPFGFFVAAVLGVVLAGPPLARQIAFAVESGQQDVSVAALADLSKHDTLSTLFREVAKAVKPAVVVVHVKQKVSYESNPFVGDDFLRRFFGGELPERFRFRREFPEKQQPKREFYQRGLGSGVIVNSDKGYVLTNWHVVRDADEVEVVLHDGRRFDTEWVRTDKQTDLAILKIKPDRLMEARLGNSDKMDVGDWVLAIGAPEGLPQTVTAGIISAKGRTTGRGDYENFLQTDAAINHGNSGGPLVNMRGKIIGINTAIVSRTGVNEGIGLSIPSNMVKNIMDQLIDSGEVVRGYLGVAIQDINQGLAKSFDLPNAKGALVASVGEDTPAEKAGLRDGDFITFVAGKSVRNVNDLRNSVAAIKPGTTVELQFYRSGKKMTVKVKIGRQSADFASNFGERSSGTKESKTADRFGLKIATMSDQYAETFGLESGLKGVVILEVDSDSDAAGKNLEPGDIITHIQGKKATSAKDLSRVLTGENARKGVRLRIRSKRGVMRYVFITPEIK